MCTKILSKYFFGILGLFIVAGWYNSAMASSYYFCVGEKKEVCNVNPTYDCYTPPQPIAQALCTAQTPEGPKPLPYIMNMVSSFSGNKCGYGIYRVDCVVNATDAEIKFKEIDNKLKLTPISPELKK